MKTIYFLSFISLFTLAEVSCSDKKTAESQTQSDAVPTVNNADTIFNIVGKKVEIQYPTMTAEVTYLSDSTLHWKTTIDGKVGEGDERVIYKPVGNGLYFINWIEKDGITVSQVADFKNNKISVYMSYHDHKSERGQRSADAFEGKLRLVE